MRDLGENRPNRSWNPAPFAPMFTGQERSDNRHMDIETPYLIFPRGCQGRAGGQDRTGHRRTGARTLSPGRCVSPAAGPTSAFPKSRFPKRRMRVPGPSSSAPSIPAVCCPRHGAVMSSKPCKPAWMWRAACTCVLPTSPKSQRRRGRLGRRLFDVRHPSGTFHTASGRKRTGKRLLTVGTDCSVGKKYTALAIERELLRRGVDADYRATGQTGILISGSGIAIDAVVADFAAGRQRHCRRMPTRTTGM